MRRIRAMRFRSSCDGADPFGFRNEARGGIERVGAVGGMALVRQHLDLLTGQAASVSNRMVE
jgi:hypothetical protein